MKRTNKFYGVLGNPPYQGEGESKNGKQYRPPIYNFFMDQAYEVGERVELITPARFLFNAGATPQEWNHKMLNDKHLKVLMHEADGSNLFPNTDIKGGIAITLRDDTKDFGSIKTFIPFDELLSIWEKVEKAGGGFQPLSEIMGTRGEHKITDSFKKDFPNWKERVSDARFSASFFKRFPEVLFENRPQDGDEYIEMLGLVDNKRVKRWIKKRYVGSEQGFLNYYRVCIPKANGSGAIGEVISTPVLGTPVLGTPVLGTTESFIAIGKFDTKEEAQHLLKYIKCKLFRALVGILKVTQNNPAEVFACVPLQDFTSSSDIDWSQSVAEIDAQLYKKYGLTDQEIEFIETKVKEMK